MLVTFAKKWIGSLLFYFVKSTKKLSSTPTSYPPPATQPLPLSDSHDSAGTGDLEYN